MQWAADKKKSSETKPGESLTSRSCAKSEDVASVWPPLLVPGLNDDLVVCWGNEAIEDKVPCVGEGVLVDLRCRRPVRVLDGGDDVGPLGRLGSPLIRSFQTTRPPVTSGTHVVGGSRVVVPVSEIGLKKIKAGSIVLHLITLFRDIKKAFYESIFISSCIHRINWIRTDNKEKVFRIKTCTQEVKTTKCHNLHSINQCRLVYPKRRQNIAHEYSFGWGICCR